MCFDFILKLFFGASISLSLDCFSISGRVISNSFSSSFFRFFSIFFVFYLGIKVDFFCLELGVYFDLEIEAEIIILNLVW